MSSNKEEDAYLKAIFYTDRKGHQKVTVGNKYEVEDYMLTVDGFYQGAIKKINVVGELPDIDAFIQEWHNKGDWESLPGKVRAAINEARVTNTFKEFLKTKAAEDFIFVRQQIELALRRKLAFVIESINEIEAGKLEW